MGVVSSREIQDLGRVDFSNMRFPMLIMYAYPIDYPRHYVVRVWDLDQPTDMILLRRSYSEAIAAIPSRFYKMDAHPNDDPKICAVFV